MDAKLNPSAFLALQLAGIASTPALTRRAKLVILKSGWLRRWAAWVRRALSSTGDGELRRMSDRELNDLGIGRSEIPHILGRGAS